MENLQNEVATLKNGIEALGVVISSFQKSVEILSLKLEEFQDRKIDIDKAAIAERIEQWMDNVLPYSVDLEWSDNNFQASAKVDLHELLKDNLPYNWEADLSEAIVNTIQDENK